METMCRLLLRQLTGTAPAPAPAEAAPEEAINRELELQRIELEKREAHNESERKKLEEMKKSTMKNSSLEMAVLERQKADENVLNVAAVQKGIKEISSRANIGVKRMGELDTRPILQAMKKKYNEEEAEDRVSELCSLWEGYLKDPDWHPFKIIVIEGKHQHINIKVGYSKMKLIIESFLFDKRSSCMKMINILFFVLCLVSGSSSHIVDGMQSALKEDLELEQKLKHINKIPVKSIHTKFGYIVDCIDINKQPAFDHPLLKNHKLQRKPSFQKTIGKTNSNSSPAKAKRIFRLEKDQCPTGTVPVRRTTKDDLIRAKSLLNNHILTQHSPGTHVAKVSLKTIPGMPYYGVSGNNSIYNPRVKKHQSSASHIWVQNGRPGATDKIITRWHVSPQLYGDDGTYLYSFWRSDSKKTGCYNVQCRGFVQTNPQIYLGSRVTDSSIYNGLMIETAFSLQQDARTKNWWLIMENANVGYFPADLFFNLTTADQVGWGGRTTTAAGTPSPPMGSGYFPDENYIHACYFIGVKYQNASRQDYEPENYLTETFTDKPDCFGVEYYGYEDTELGYALQFGGPGGACFN
ncbi:protein neprosin-like [Gastrolobium bilobum]|uniref:protein neprosin-like n=1 Tax=Gastrolobium bilobum TaxID=150636 RepID=UPI002AB2CB2B|nr:protein neprosin-like [Gastrolobium bilobum]